MRPGVSGCLSLMRAGFRCSHSGSDGAGIQCESQADLMRPARQQSGGANIVTCKCASGSAVNDRVEFVLLLAEFGELKYACANHVVEYGGSVTKRR